MVVTEVGSYWRKEAGALVRLVNFWWWLDLAAPWWLGLNLLSVAAALLWRRWFDLGYGFGGAYLLGLLVVWGLGFARARGRFIDFEKGLGRLDRAWNLQGALYAANHGAASWPPVKTGRVKVFRVSLNRIHLSLVLSFLVLGIGLLLPVQKLSPKPELEVVAGPNAWAEMEEWLSVMDASELVEEESLDAFEQRLDSLVDQPREDWFSEGSLEATDFLAKQSKESTLQFLESLDMAMQSASRFSGGDGAELGERDMRQLSKSIENLDLGTLALREDLMKTLSELAESGQSSVDQQTLQEMLDRMKEGAETVQKGMGLPRYQMGPMQAERRPGSGEDGEEGPTPLTISEGASARLAGNLEGISNEDRERAILGDTAFTSEVQIEDFEAEAHGKQAGERTHNVGEGGSAVWQMRARPKEQALLKNYFGNE
ncbi:hypothetical protein QEH56_04535 [Pelagicoccus enzymogenes]|nr:hypothetical protein [Pelagicoccus enzymogenes]